VTIKDAVEITGGLSFPSKMPCPAFSLPTISCKVGSALRHVSGSICSKCYACKGRYCFSNVKNALQKRFGGLIHPDWTEAMVVLINHYAAPSGYFRWHDSGDLGSFRHLAMIDDVVSKTPDIKHRLPTKEYSTVAQYILSVGSWCSNLNIRLSQPMIDIEQPFIRGLEDLSTSICVSDVSNAPKGSYICPATTSRRECGTCRKCWEKSTKTVCYVLH